MRILRRRHAALDARVADAAAREETAREEARLSEARRKAVVKNIAGPLRRAAERNQFADLIRHSLIEGHGGGTP